MKNLALSRLIAAGSIALSPAAGWAQAAFDPATAVLTVPTIKVGSATYRDLKARLDPDGRLTILSLTPPPSPPASFSSCQAPSAVWADSFVPRAVFQTPAQMWEVLSGTWVGCDVDGRTVSITISGRTASGTISRHSNYYGAYNYCTYTLDSSYPFIATGHWSLNVQSLTCAEGDARDRAYGDVFTLYAKGGPGVATELLLELKFRVFARVARLQ